MEYTALIFDTCLDETDSYENLIQTITLYKNDENCKQIVVSCCEEWMLKLAMTPIKKVLLVKMAKAPYMALLNGLKAVSQENVIVNGLSMVPTKLSIQKLLEALEKYPAIYIDNDLQAYDTRLLMFSLQVAIERNLVIENYSQAVASLSDTPLQHIER